MGGRARATPRPLGAAGVTTQRLPGDARDAGRPTCPGHRRVRGAREMRTCGACGSTRCRTVTAGLVGLLAIGSGTLSADAEDPAQRLRSEAAFVAVMRAQLDSLNGISESLLANDCDTAGRAANRLAADAERLADAHTARFGRGAQHVHRHERPRERHARSARPPGPSPERR